jgi:hypothetical protein
MLISARGALPRFYPMLYAIYLIRVLSNAVDDIRVTKLIIRFTLLFVVDTGVTTFLGLLVFA